MENYLWRSIKSAGSSSPSLISDSHWAAAPSESGKTAIESISLCNLSQFFLGFDFFLISATVDNCSSSSYCSLCSSSSSYCRLAVKCNYVPPFTATFDIAAREQTHKGDWRQRQRYRYRYGRGWKIRERETRIFDPKRTVEGSRWMGFVFFFSGSLNQLFGQ